MNTKHEIQFVNHSIKNAIICQMCSAIQPDIYLCNACYSFACTECAKSHICFDDNKQLVFERQFLKLEKKSSKGIELVKRSSQSNKTKINDLFGNKKYYGVSCQRCHGNSATKECRQCKIKYFCETCFTTIHNSKKLNSHESFLIEDQLQKKGSNDYTVKITSPKSNKMGALPSNILPPQKQYLLDNLQSSLQVAKDTLQLEYTNYQNEARQSLHSIQHCFEQLIEEVKLKMFQLTAKVKESQQSSLINYQHTNKLICSQFNTIANLRIISREQLEDSLPAGLMASKLQKNKNRIQQTIKQNYANSYERFSLDVIQEIELIKFKLKKIELKKVAQLEGHKSSLNDSVCQSDKNGSHSQKNESKKLKTFLNLNSCKSTEKLTPIQLGLTSPKKANINGKAFNQFPTINKSLFIQTLNSSQCRQKEMDRCQTMNNLKISQNGKQKNYQKSSKLSLTNLMSPKTTKKMTRDIQNVSKSNLVKAGIKIQKTKKMITDIRNEMKQFTNRFTFQKQGSKTSMQGNSESLDISQLSIQSCIASRQDQN